MYLTLLLRLHCEYVCMWHPIHFSCRKSTNDYLYSDAITRSLQEIFKIPNRVEPLNNEHFGTSQFWCNSPVIERLSSLRGKIVLPHDPVGTAELVLCREVKCTVSFKKVSIVCT